MSRRQRRHRSHRSTAPVLLAAALAAAGALAAPAAGGEAIWTSFAARDLDGRLWTAEDLAGRVVLLDFWATWCAPCLAALPGLRQAHERFADRGFVLLGVSLDRGDRRELEGFLRRQGIDWPQFHDGRGVDGALARRFGVEAVPRTLLVDRAGRIVGVDLESDVLLAALPSLVAAGEPSPADRQSD